jgi:predicted small secreted protein/alpha-beta hydrolase superfamily lysophospholipase
MKARHVVIVALVITATLATACPGSRGAGRPIFGSRGPPRLGAPPTVDDKGQPVEAPPPMKVVREERTIVVHVSGKASDAPDADPSDLVQAELGALLVKPDSGPGPTILVVPGGSDISRNGTRTGDGVGLYAKPVDVSLAWAEAFAARGAHVLLWDKRTCGPNDDPVCRKNPQDDVDAQGPAAMAKDVDAACALAKAESGFNGQLVLFAHGQATQVALSSQCARDATAIVMLAPIPRAIDEVIVAGLKERTDDVEKAAKSEKDPAQKQALLEQANQLKNLAGTREAEFSSIKKDRFAPTARVNGATLAFWKGWMDVTGRTSALVDEVNAPKVVVLGGKDLQYGDKDRVRIRALAPDAYVEVQGADHHLLTNGALAKETVDVVGAALDKVLAVPAS